MSSARDSSSDATKSDGEAITTEFPSFRARSSSDESKKRKQLVVDTLPQKPAPLLNPTPDPNSYGLSNCLWVPGHYIPNQALARGHRAIGQPPPFPSTWTGAPLGLPEPCALVASQHNGDRFLRRKRRTSYDMARTQRATAGAKPNRVIVLPGGEVDNTYEGKNAWDEALHDLVPKCLDMSVVEWSKHESHKLKKLRAALDSEFEYLGSPLSMTGFRLSIIDRLCGQLLCFVQEKICMIVIAYILNIFEKC